MNVWCSQPMGWAHQNVKSVWP